MPASATPSIADIERIAALPDPVICNLHITQCYHQLALALAERTGQGANWCVFATWASKQAGRTIRKEDLARTLEQVLGEEEGPQAARQIVDAARRLGVRFKVEKLLVLLWKAVDPEGAIAQSSRAVARGNRKVFAEIGREFARFFGQCLGDSAYQADKIARFNEGLLPGQPPQGQEYLRRAFNGYYQALFETGGKARSELLLLANIQIGLHEQTRLQPEINEALEAPVITPQTFTRNLLRAYYPHNNWMADALWIVLSSMGRLVGFDAAVARYLAAARRQAQSLVTETMMTIELPPHRLLRLGQDLSAGFPPVLQHIANPDLASLLAQIDPTPDSNYGSGAHFWGDLPDRLHFIADMFRCYQTSAEMFAPPFTEEQTTALLEGRMPAGRL